MKSAKPSPSGRSSTVFLLLLGLASAGGAQGDPALRVSARSLVAIATNALGAVQQAAAADPRLAADPGRIAPFWASLQGANQALAEIGAGLGATDHSPATDLFARIARAGGRIAELSASWERIGLPNPGVQSGLVTLTTSWTVFRGTYGPEGVRHRQDRPLSAEEAHRLEVVRRAQEALIRHLERLEAKARRAQEIEEARRLASFRQRNERFLLAGGDLEAYLTALAALPEIEGEWAALKAAAPKARRAAYAAADPIVEQIQTEAETGSVMVLDLDEGKAWSFLDQTTELPESLSAELAAFEGIEGENEGNADGSAESTEEAEEEVAASDEKAPCAEDDEECLAAEDEEALASTPSPTADETAAAHPAPATPSPAFPGLCGDAKADGCMAAPENPVTAPSTSTASTSPPGLS